MMLETSELATYNLLMKIAPARVYCITVPLLLLLCVLPAQPQSCTVAPSSLISWWTGDTNENDIIGGNNPSAVSAVTLATGEVQDGFTFGHDGYIEIPASSTLANQRFTWAAWVMPAGPGPNNDSFGSVIVDQDIDNTNGSVDLLWSDATQRFLFLFGYQYSEIITSTDIFPAGTFYFVAGTYDGSTFRLYVNGVLEGSFSEAKTVAYSSNPWTIGSALPLFISENYARTWNGVIDEVQAYSAALSQSEIQAIYNAGAAGVCKGLTFLPGSLKFARQTLGTTSAPLVATITNAFPLAVTLNNVVPTGDFDQTNTCPAPPEQLLSGADCSVSVTFTPTAKGPRTGQITFDHT